MDRTLIEKVDFYKKFREEGVDKTLRNYVGNIRKKQKCFVHAGMHKTGTTSIQNFLNVHTFNSDAKYLKLNEANHSVAFFSLFGDYPDKYLANIERNNHHDLEQYHFDMLSMFVSDFKSCDKSNMIISGEDISVLPLHGLNLFKEFLSYFFEEIVVILYVRNPVDLLVSTVNQRAKIGLFKSLDLNAHYTVYQAILEKFDIVFGKDEVKMKHYHRSDLHNNDIISDICLEVGIDVPIGTKMIHGNKSLNLLTTSYLYYINNHFGNKYMGYFKVVSELVRKLRSIDNKKFYFNKILIDKVMSRNLSDINWVEKRINMNFAGFLESYGSKSEGFKISTEEDIYGYLYSNRYLIYKAFDFDEDKELFKSDSDKIFYNFTSKLFC